MSLDPLRDDFTLRQGTTFLDSLQCFDDDNAVVPLTGATVWMHVRAKPEALQPILALSIGAGLTVDAAAGRITRTITPAQSRALPAGTWPYDLFVSWPDGTITCLAVGELTVSPRLTRIPNQ